MARRRVWLGKEGVVDESKVFATELPCLTSISDHMHVRYSMIDTKLANQAYNRISHDDKEKASTLLGTQLVSMY